MSGFWAIMERWILGRKLAQENARNRRAAEALDRAIKEVLER